MTVIFYVGFWVMFHAGETCAFLFFHLVGRRYGLKPYFIYNSCLFRFNYTKLGFSYIFIDSFIFYFLSFSLSFLVV